MKQANLTGGPLSQRRTNIETQWSRFVAGSPFVKTENVRDDIMSSWLRSAQHIKPRQPHAPADDEYTAAKLWQESQLCQAARREQDAMMQLAREGELVAAIADPCGRLLWTFASSHMQRRAESVNFTAGGHWDERSVGTNAVGLSLKLRRSVTVFSSEHYLPFVHDWVCYAAPIIHPQSGECVGILDMSTTWNRHTPLGQAAVTELARSIATGLPQNLPRAELEIHALGQPRVLFRGKPLNLPMRQVEILCLLALNPQGLSLEGFHAALYGDSPVSTATLKSELSHLRRVLDGQIGSRPYRLLIPAWADFIQVWQTLRQQRTSEAFSLYRGSFLPQSESPELEEWRHCIDAVMGKALESCQDPSLLMEKLCHSTAGSELVRERLAELASAGKL
ncbi:helix-turn-helix domain-containing protein [Thiothrix nivea]|uniref:Transcriptional regulator domain-containing protein n=1 Tax=Thiothrix nivea (strain ATCC 35100 / DSM 5205 / JP2) TaxID=870187 RepID=A0A656HCI0_THINJ|nr:helix-turn-helix domain-containing protein [Thiothrix nivea]EIJ34861.1 transcriptional regulator domain-containing protein [Thiothrix nivea DSM 5205]